MFATGVAATFQPGVKGESLKQRTRLGVGPVCVGLERDLRHLSAEATSSYGVIGSVRGSLILPARRIPRSVLAEHHLPGQAGNSSRLSVRPSVCRWTRVGGRGRVRGQRAGKGRRGEGGQRGCGAGGSRWSSLGGVAAAEGIQLPGVRKASPSPGVLAGAWRWK